MWSTYDCELVKCMNERDYGFCYECPDYDVRTCARFEKFSKRYIEEDDVDLRKNLSMIEEDRVEEWLAESEKLFTCPHCGKPIASGAKKCHHCNFKL